MTKLNEADASKREAWIEEKKKEIEDAKEALIKELDSSGMPKLANMFREYEFLPNNDPSIDLQIRMQAFEKLVEKKKKLSRFQKLKIRLLIELKILRWNIIKVLYKNRLIKERFMVLASLVKEENTLYRYKAFRIKKEKKDRITQFTKWPN